MSSANKTVEQVMSVREKTLQEQYSLHDIGQEYLESQLEEIGFRCEQHGTENRDHDGDHVTYGEGPDIALYRGDELVGYIEVKCKRSTSPAWYGRLNKRHFEHYVEFAAHTDEPVFIWFSIVDEDKQMILREDFIPVKTSSCPHCEGDIVDHEQVADTHYSRGNVVYALVEDDFRNYNWLVQQVI